MSDKKDDFLIMVQPSDKIVKITTDYLTCPVIEVLTDGEIRSSCKFAKMKSEDMTISIGCSCEDRTEENCLLMSKFGYKLTKC